MILGRSDAGNKRVAVEIEVEPGGGWLTFTPAEYELLLGGELLRRKSGDCHGDFTITAQLVRPEFVLRCHYADCTEGHPLAGEGDRVTCPVCREAMGIQRCYILCKHCDHFVDPNDSDEPGAAEYIHLEDGEQEFDHDAAPSRLVHTQGGWKDVRPDLFKEYPDGKIGPNSIHHSRRGKVG